MSEDLTIKLPSDAEKRILMAVQNLEKSVRVSIDNLVTWVGTVDSRLQRLEQRVEERLHDTRPIWHKVVADIAQLQAGQQRLEQGQDKVVADIAQLQAGQQRLEQGHDDARQILHKVVADIAQLQAGQQRLEQGHDDLRVELREVHDTVNRLSHEQSILNDGIRKTNREVHEIDERVHRLEVDRKRPNSST